ncbi:MAG TPA: FAD-dependent oxidoreductase [Solirubrobacteraceae bacterium]|nr:FAD-dependent oxidoreductase [Solirubrobacteraceae bacterium]
MNSQRVAIVGAGITGVCAAWIAADRGIPVLLIDSRMLAGSGTSYSSGGSIGLQDKTSPGTVALAIEAIDFYRALREEWSAFGDAIEWCGGLVPYWGDADRAALVPIAAGLQAAGVEVDELSPTDALNVAQALSPDIGGAYYCSAEGRMAPATVAKRMLQILQERGDGLIEWSPRTTVTAITPGKGGYVLEVEGSHRRREIEVSAVILATGSYYSETDWPVERGVQPRRGVILTFDALKDMDVVMHGSSYTASKESVLPDLAIAFAFEPRDGMWRIGSSRELVGRSDSGLDTLIAKVRHEAERYIPSLKGHPVRSVGLCYRPFESGTCEHVCSGTGDYARVVTINGQEGEGITLAPALARLALDILDECR